MQLKPLTLTMTFQRTVTTPLSLCLTPGVHPTALLHHLTVDLLRESFYSSKRKAAPGVDGVTWQEYEDGLEDRLTDLHGRIHRGAYRAMPSRRMYIEKEDGRQRPLAIPALEDKLAQQAVVTILNQIYEEDFLGFSYGFRPGRSQHQALDALSYALLRKKVNYVLMPTFEVSLITSTKVG